MSADESAAGNGVPTAATRSRQHASLSARPGRQPLSDDGCSICGAHAYCEFDGAIVSGCYGSEYDLARFVWIGEADDAPPQGALCDGCVKKACETGCLELFGNVTDRHGFPSVPSPSAAAYAALFAAGFHQIDRLIYAETGGSCEPHGSPSLEDLALVAQLRLIVVKDEVFAPAYTLSVWDGWRAINAGQAHALAARALCVRMDPAALTEYARDWAEARKKRDEILELLVEKLI